MELVEEKYKQTEVGLIPADWELTQLENLTTKIGSGITPTGGASVYKGSGRPFVRSQNIGWGNLILEDIAFIDDDTHQTFPNTEIKLNDVFLNISGASIGRSSYANEKLVGGNVNQHVCIIRITEGKLNPTFLNLFLLSKNGQKQIDSFQSGGNRQGLNIGQIKTFLIPLPPFFEQTAIATALSDMDALIARTEKLIEKMKAIKQGMMQQLLSPFDREGNLKVGWRIKLLNDVFTFGSTANYSRAELSMSDAIGYIHYGDIHTKYNSFLDGQGGQLPAISQDQAKGFTMIQEGDVVIADASEDYNGVGKSIEVINLGGKRIIAGLHTILLRDSTSSFHAGFLGLLFDSKFIKDQFCQLATGLKVYSLSKSILKQVKLFVPPRGEQESISNLILDLISEIEGNNQKLEKLKLIKQSMMQSLLTGKIRIYNPEHEPSIQV